MAKKVKAKTKKAVVARFKLTGTGKLLRSRQGKRHILSKKSAKRKRHLGNAALVATTHLNLYKRLIKGV